jgi:mono/diheme cytochrome c family protein
MMLALLFVMATGGCEQEKFTKSMKLGGKMVSAEQLNAGYEGYMLYCYACHGEHGNGKGPAAPGLRPPPRDFTLGKFKFAAVASGQLPRDEDFERIVTGGLNGSAMLPWDVPRYTLRNIIQYIKTFHRKGEPNRWETEDPGEPIAITADPFGPARAQQAAEEGKKVYHGLAQCWSCHPAYATRKEIYEIGKTFNKEMTDFRDDMYHPALKDSDYGFNILPPDFTAQPLRSIRVGHEMEDLFRVIASGIGGTAMPQWKGALPDDKIWAMAYYMRSLMMLRDTAGVVALRGALEHQGDWKPPTPPAPGEQQEQKPDRPAAPGGAAQKQPSAP